MSTRWFICIILFLFPMVTLAQDSFLVSQTIGGVDTIAPSTPNNFTVTAISISQIDLSWDASSDNVGIDGYQVFRDNAQIATTTATSYSDTGLAESTLYSYRIVAFDAAFNFATSTATTSTSTLATPAPAPNNNGGGGGGSVEPTTTEIENLTITSDSTSAEIDFSTNVYVTTSVRWGKSSEYESGYLVNDVFKKSHQIALTNLEPGTTYQLEILLTRRFSGEPLVYATTFTTTPSIDTVSPSNVTDFTVVAVSEGLALRWTAPPAASYVRVVSNESFYPTDPFNGRLVYEGEGNTSLDTRVLESPVRYYTIYAYDQDDNYSSGAVAEYRVSGVGLEVVSDDGGDTPVIPDAYQAFSTSDITVIQNQTARVVADAVAVIDKDIPLTFSVPYTALPEHLKTIIVTLYKNQETSEQFSFLLRLNDAGTAYEAVLAGLNDTGTYVVEVAVYDHTTNQVVKTAGELIVTDGEAAVEPVYVETVTIYNWPLIITVGSGWLLLLLFLVRRLLAM